MEKIISVKIIEGFIIKMRLVKLFDLLNNYYVFLKLLSEYYFSIVYCICDNLFSY